MNADLMPFTYRPNCPKCGNDDRHVWKYLGAGEAVTGRQEEHLGLKCGRCGYIWDMATDDSPGDDHDSGGAA